MSYVIRCDCGTDNKGRDEDEVVANGIAHAREGHAMPSRASRSDRSSRSSRLARGCHQLSQGGSLSSR